jgi:hypothetical protein
MPELLSQPSGLRIELDYQIDGEYIFSIWDSCDRLLAAVSGDRYTETESRFEWMLLELKIFI